MTALKWHAYKPDEIPDGYDSIYLGYIGTDPEMLLTCCMNSHVSEERAWECAKEAAGKLNRTGREAKR